MNDITTPLRLAVGSHQAGSGAGCAMNVISWESGDSTISDMPKCADRLLAKVVQAVNDSYCEHIETIVTIKMVQSASFFGAGEKIFEMPTENRVGLLCPDCSIKVLDLAHRTVGTALDLDVKGRNRLYLTMALEALPHSEFSNDGKIRDLAVAFIRGGDVWYEVNRLIGHGGLSYPYNALLSSLYLAAGGGTCESHLNPIFWYGKSRRDMMASAHALITRFEELTGVHATPVAPEITAAAVAKMVAV